MKNKLNRILSTFLALIVLLACSQISTFAGIDARSNTYFNDIIKYNTCSKSIQEWIDTDLCNDAGYGSEWYVIALSQNEKKSGKKYDYSKFESSLINYTKRVKNINPTARQRIALCLASIGSTKSFISDTMNSTIGKQGIMSYIFGLHLLNNSYVSKTHSKSSVINKIIDLRCSDGGWALYGSSSDSDVTAMAIQALAPHYSDSKVKKAINGALDLLSTKQESNGTFTTINNGSTMQTCESTTQVLLALSCLGIDANNDSRFIKNGNDLFDALEIFKNTNGFSHIKNGTVNNLATQQVFYTMVAYSRMNNLFILDKARPNEVEKNAEEKTTVMESEDNNSNNAAVNTNKNINQENSNSKDISNIEQSTNTSNIKKNANADNTNSNNEALNEDGFSQDVDVSNKGVSTQGNTNNGTIESNSINKDNKKISYKVWASLIIILLAICISITLYLTKKGNKGNYLIVIAVSIIAILITILTNFQSVSSHNDSISQKQNIKGTVTISINCNTIKDKSDKEFIPSDGIILDNTKIDIEENETVYDVLNEVCTKNKIQLETAGTKDSIYIEGINNIYELEYGDLSGWMYHVNGTEPSNSCGNYELADGDKIEWLYTCDLGNDIK